MVEESSSSSFTRSIRPGDDFSTQQRRRSLQNHPNASAEVPLNPGIRRRSSNLTDFSLDDARKSFRSSTDDLLLPKASMHVKTHGLENPSHWHSAPLAFALFPAIGGMFFKNGSSIITDITLLGLAAIFLNWSVRLPWDWYFSAQRIREKEEYNAEAVTESETDDENNLEASQISLEDIEEEDQSPTPKPPKRKRLPSHEAASNELYIHELLALLSCFISPIIGAYLLHTIRSQLSRPSEGLVSNYNLTIFLLAAEFRPLSHLVKLVQSRTLHLQRLVNHNPYNNKSTATLAELTTRLIQLELKISESLAADGTADAKGTMTAKQVNAITTSIRQTLQPDLDALNRAVRRYEKRATLQTMQTESRLSDLESRLNDAISLAAAAANNNLHTPGFLPKLMEWIGIGLALPFQGLISLAALPFKTMVSIIAWGKGLMRRKEVVDGKGKKTVKGQGYRGSARSLKRN